MERLERSEPLRPAVRRDKEAETLDGIRERLRKATDEDARIRERRVREIQQKQIDIDKTSERRGKSERSKEIVDKRKKKKLKYGLPR